eukprot:m51a1_g7202 hypothetical protein (329) ;mRNA; f:203245-204447
MTVEDEEALNEILASERLLDLARGDLGIHPAAQPGVEIGVATDDERDQGMFSIGAFVTDRSTGRRGVITAGHPFGHKPVVGPHEPEVLVEVPSRKKSTAGAAYLKLRRSVCPNPEEDVEADAAFLELLDQELGTGTPQDMLSALTEEERAEVHSFYGFHAAPLEGSILITPSSTLMTAGPARAPEVAGTVPRIRSDFTVSSSLVYKIGCGSGITKGTLAQCHVVVLRHGVANVLDLVEPLVSSGALPRPERTGVITGQLRVRDVLSDGEGFAVPGDSGSLVWTRIVDDDAEKTEHFAAVGIQSGTLNQEFHVVTPIQAALDALGVNLV